MQQVTEIRLEILKNEGMGYSKAETVKNIRDKLNVSFQDVYYHYSVRDKWQNDFLNYKDIKELQNIKASRLNHIYREACFQYSHADNSNAKCGFLRLMLDITLESVTPNDSTNDPVDKIEVTILNNTANPV